MHQRNGHIINRPDNSAPCACLFSLFHEGPLLGLRVLLGTLDLEEQQTPFSQDAEVWNACAHSETLEAGAGLLAAHRLLSCVPPVSA